MATVHITVSTVRNKSQAGQPMPVPRSVPEAADTMTSSAVSQQSTIVANPEGENHSSSRYWCVTALGNVWINFGTNPTAAAESGWLVLAGVPTFFSVSAKNEKIAIKDAA
jgi:hypothetical protein